MQDGMGRAVQDERIERAGCMKKSPGRNFWPGDFEDQAANRGALARRPPKWWMA